jgi:hypothetical protein
METHKLWNEKLKLQIYVGNKTNMGNVEFINPKPQAKI